jgi:hypothetical protein
MHNPKLSQLLFAAVRRESAIRSGRTAQVRQLSPYPAIHPRPVYPALSRRTVR